MKFLWTHDIYLPMIYWFLKLKNTDKYIQPLEINAYVCHHQILNKEKSWLRVLLSTHSISTQAFASVRGDLKRPWELRRVEAVSPSYYTVLNQCKLNNKHMISEAT